ncbi:MAG TPA: DEAD/DEAH box helicase [Polyangia bacterium]|jgi:ATP-dependent RNA helicase RhlE
MRFEDLQLIDPLVRAVHAAGYAEPTPIQVQAIPQVLTGRDVLGCAQTGTGKTAAFALPILQRLVPGAPPAAGPRPVRVLVLSPTRELAAQIGDSFSQYGRHTGLTNTVIFGGVGQDAQTKALRRGVDIVVATPGRLLDLMGQRHVNFDRLEVLVLDEADRMLDMGFIHDVRRIIAALPRKRQTLFFSATLPRDIQELAHDILRDPVRVEVTPAATTVESIRQAVYFVEKSDKRALLEHILADPSITRALVFTRTKHGADRVVRGLGRGGGRAEAIHGNKSQNARERALTGFKSGAIRALVATDIAARGIDVDDVSHVINFDLPNESEVYVHRIGRTGRAGASGIALSFCDFEEREYLADIERLIGLQIPVVAEHPYASRLGVPAPVDPSARRGQPQRGQPRGGQPQRGRQQSPRPRGGPSRGGAPGRGPRPAQAPQESGGSLRVSPAPAAIQLGDSAAARTISAGLRAAEQRRRGGGGGGGGRGGRR